MDPGFLQDVIDGQDAVSFGDLTEGGYDPSLWNLKSVTEAVESGSFDPSEEITEQFQIGSLHIAAALGRPDVCKYLIDKKADVNARTCEDADSFGDGCGEAALADTTPLGFALVCGQKEAVKVLIENGSNVNDVYGTIGSEELKESNDAFENFDYVYTCSTTPLSLAALRGDVELWKMLIEAGASITKSATEEANPLMYAAGLGHSELLTHILENHASDFAKLKRAVKEKVSEDGEGDEEDDSDNDDDDDDEDAEWSDVLFKKAHKVLKKMRSKRPRSSGVVVDIQNGLVGVSECFSIKDNLKELSFWFDSPSKEWRLTAPTLEAVLGTPPSSWPSDGTAWKELFKNPPAGSNDRAKKFKGKPAVVEANSQFEVHNCFKIKDKLKASGFKFDFNTKVWRASKKDMEKALGKEPDWSSVNDLVQSL